MADHPVMLFDPLDGRERDEGERREMARRQGAILRLAISKDDAALERLRRALVKGWVMSVGVN